MFLFEMFAFLSHFELSGIGETLRIDEWNEVLNCAERYPRNLLECLVANLACAVRLYCCIFKNCSICVYRVPRIIIQVVATFGIYMDAMYTNVQPQSPRRPQNLLVILCVYYGCYVY